MIKFKIISGMAGDATVIASLEYCRHVLCTQLPAVAIFASASVYLRCKAIALGGFGVGSLPRLETSIDRCAVFFGLALVVVIIGSPSLIEGRSLLFVFVAPFLVVSAMLFRICSSPSSSILFLFTNSYRIGFGTILEILGFIWISLFPTHHVVGATPHARSCVGKALRKMSAFARISCEEADKTMRLGALAIDYLHASPLMKEKLS